MGEHQPATRLRRFEALSDEQIVHRVVGGDAPLFELLMRRYNRRLFRIARGVLDDDFRAEDAIQDAYLSAFTNLHQFRGPDGFASWLSRIAYRAALKVARQARPYDDDPNDIPADQLAEPDRLAESHEYGDRIHAALDRLPADYRVVFNLRELERLSVAETAAVLGIRQATVKSRLFRSKALLRIRLGRHFGRLAEQALPFGGASCDGLVARVFQLLEVQ